MSDETFNILVVDDESRVRLAIRRVLEKEGHLISEAGDGLQALQAIAANQPDLVLVDLMMPEMDGMELLGEARKAYPDLPFVVITGYATLDKAVEAMKQGADDFMAKPFKPTELRMVVDRVLKRVRTLQDMAVEKSRTRVLVNSMSNGVVVVDARSRVALMNPALAHLIEVDQEDSLGKDMHEVLPCQKVLAALDQVLAMEASDYHTVECDAQLGTAEDPHHLTVHCEPFLDGRQKLVGAMAVFNDVTALHRLDELKNEYVSTVAHDIASPLASVLSQIQVMRQGLAGPLTEKQEHLLNRAGSRIQGIIDLSADLLDLSKIESGSLGQADRVELTPLLNEAADLLAEKAKEKKHQVSLEVADNLPPVKGVAGELTRVFTNLLSNAIKYTAPGGQIKVGAKAEPGLVKVWVSDNGFGMSQEDAARVFDRFYRIKDENTRMIVGTGLGLPIVKKVVEGHGGAIAVASEPGKGSTFTVTLPTA